MDQLLAIRAFARVVEAGSFTRAADSLTMPTTTVSKLVRELETYLNVRLLQRTTRRVSVTNEGLAYYEQTARLLRDLEEVDTGLRTAQVKPRGKLKVDIGSSVATELIIPALPEFFARYPDIRLEVGVSDRHVDLISESVDCAIRGGELKDLSLAARSIGHACWVTCATPAYLERFGRPTHPTALENGHQLIDYLSARTGRVMPAVFERGRERFEITGHSNCSVNESNAHVAAALAGLGIIHTFGYTVQKHIDSGALVPFLEAWRPAPYPFHVVYAPNRYLSHRVRVFIDWLAERFQSTLANRS
ncbi:LysR family transcriptional regulator [Pseudomonas gingeri]|uniref:LysR substrate-binding domain-containing protein n=1 Tax=Pseudomonas gingeri TaxID=117681 RepID=UPI0015A310D5|nr:LysR family transcriptional regulator [Pseudomonas gingeri]NVZ28617.1 LysR family transcriptional regulator [Pseudomonas gingeri]NVZ62716.1 LysR family transcriptional regulator [Pseudomonas gingeri]NVZ77259.1 LysR family transcriptional regulator [Pseudomonas gingeri]NWA08321.1 LysR family transcriptional regulator [Pseudomonas gingeri]NWE45653.1 LysR family transcriptional regulator [Pseudomonas gingeri]